MSPQLAFGNMPQPAPQLRNLRETPTDRIRETGAQNVSLLELLGSIVGNSDAALTLLSQYPTLLDIARANIAELANIHGLGQSSAARIKAALELGRRMTTNAEERPQIRCPADSANLLMSEMSTLEQEHLKVMLLDTRCRVIDAVTVYVGSLNTTTIRIAELFREAIRRNAAAIIIAHNHPSGDPSPSPEDVAVTRNAVAVGKMLDIDVLDHIVIGNQRFVSLKERGLGFD